MNSRERVWKAIHFQEPDRVPLDLGGNTMLTTICAGAYNDLRRHLGLNDSPTRMGQIHLMTVEVGEAVRQRLGCDVVPVTSPVDFLGLDLSRRKPWHLPWDGSEVLAPLGAGFREDSEGGVTLYREGEWETSFKFYMPKGCHYFEIPSCGIDDFLDGIVLQPPLPDLEALRLQLRMEPFDEMTFRHFQDQARYYHEETEYSLMADGFNTYVPSGEALTWLTNTLVLMRQNPDAVHEWFDLAADVAIHKTRRLLDALEDRCDIIVATCGDFGQQHGEFLPPEMFGRFYVPAYRKLYRYIHENSNMKIFHHSCGAISRLLPYFIEAGLDIINPVQTEARGMEAEKLMAEFGGKIVFWGGGVDVQQVLPMGSVEEVRADVTRRVRTFMPGGGFVFNPIHNVQDKVPPENLVAAFDTAREVGIYGPRDGNKA